LKKVNIDKYGYSKKETFLYELMIKEVSEGLDCSLKCKTCDEALRANDLEHNFQNYFVSHCTKAKHKNALELASTIPIKEDESASSFQLNMKYLKDLERVPV